ncbi:MAG: caspase family protein [Betaproteobacteria bacterium]|nr:caspase family protein [Betaproteobacteria bacterium]
MRFALLFVVAVAAFAARAETEPRVALVIGNAAYTAPEPALRNPVNDAQAVAQALQEAGFSVKLVADADHASMRRAVREFEDMLRKQKGVGFFYFAGHGMNVEGHNFLVPIGAHLQSEDEALERAIDANQLIIRLRDTGSRLNIVVLDACRDNPLTKPQFAARGAAAPSPEGLAPMRPASGTLVAFAAEPGRIAGDGTGERGLYARHLVRFIRTPGLSLEQVFKRVREAVEQETRGAQVPVEFSTLTGGDFYFLTAGGK